MFILKTELPTLLELQSPCRIPPFQQRPATASTLFQPLGGLDNGDRVIDRQSDFGPGGLEGTGSSPAGVRLSRVLGPTLSDVEPGLTLA